MKTLLSILVLFLITGFSAETFGSTLPGQIEGVILDAKTKESIIGAYVVVENESLGTTTDLDGLFILRMSPGTYTITVSCLGYETRVIKDVNIIAGEKMTLNVVLNTQSLMLNEVVVTETRRTHTEAASLIEIKQARQVVSAISGQQIAKSLDENAAQVMQRVPGVTILENRFVMIRGLSERYNNVMINNVVAPSTEVDKRTFSFDLVPSGILDKMLIYKSGTADLPGDYAGGVIKLFTTNAVGDKFTRLSLGVGYRDGTTGQDYWQSAGSPTDFLGFDNGFRALPGNFPTSKKLQNTARNSELRQTAAHSLTNNFEPFRSMAMPDFSLGLNIGRKLQFGGGRTLSFINAVSWSQSFQNTSRDFYRYFAWVDQTQPIVQRFAFIDNSYQKNNRLSVLSNWNLRITDKTRMTFKNLLNVLGENETVIRKGKDFIQRPDDNLQNYLLGYTSRLIYTGQLELESDFNAKQQGRWVIGGSFLNESEPDLRRFRTYRNISATEGENYTMQLPPSSNLFETGRYFGTLNEFSVNHGFDYTWDISGKAEKSRVLKMGYYGDYRNRSFDSRYFSYLYPGFFNPDALQVLNKLPLSDIFSNENMRTQDGFVIEEGTRPIDSYNASSILGAGYGSYEMTVGRFNFNLGIRAEYNLLQLKSRDDISDIHVKEPVFSLLPFVNTGIKLSTNSMLRMGYGRTVNRPEFRELAPFLFYDYNMEAAMVGNPDLKSASIDNADLRFEFYPRTGELISAGVFYKHFTNPIENRVIITTEQPSFTFMNADKAQNYGVEIELRKSFKGMTSSRFIDRFSMNTNASWIISNVDLGSGAVAQDRERPLQGQSPYIVNTSLYYQDENRFSVSLAYNVFGPRIYSVGDVLFPTIYELPRHSLDFTVTKQFGNSLTAKFGIKDALNARYRFYEDSDRNSRITALDNRVFSYKRGTLINLSLTYDLYSK